MNTPGQFDGDVIIEITAKYLGVDIKLIFTQNTALRVRHPKQLLDIYHIYQSYHNQL